MLPYPADRDGEEVLMSKILLCLMIPLLSTANASAWGRLRDCPGAGYGPAAVWYGWGAPFPGATLMPVVPLPPVEPAGHGPAALWFGYGAPVPGATVVPVVPLPSLPVPTEPPLAPQTCPHL